jgi:ATP-binding cassette subfamily B protein
MVFDTPLPGMRFFAHEVVQTSAMDCGPAALKSILAGFGIPVSYGRLREACQTDVDGTSIDTIEDLAVQLGLQAEQIMIPADHIMLPESQSLPAIVVVLLPNGLTHFLVVWGRVGGFVQVMDPASGRRWPSWSRFVNELYIHSMPVPATAWRDWAGTEGMLAPLRRRMADLGIPSQIIDTLIGSAVSDPGWRSIAALDAATRMTASLVASKGIARGVQASAILERFYAANRIESDLAGEADASGAGAGIRIPASYWSVMSIPTEEAEAEASPEELLLRGAVLVRITGRGMPTRTDLGEAGQPAELSPDLVNALREPERRPEWAVWKALREDGLLNPAVLGLALFLASLTVMIEAILLQGILQVGQSLGMVSQRFGAYLVLMAFVLTPLLLEFPTSSMVLRMGRHLETRLRIAYLEKIPRLGDRYFRSRLTSDMTQRAYDLRLLRSLPNVGVTLLRLLFQLTLTALGVIWLDPASAPLAILGTAVFIALSFITRPILDESDLRFRTHTGALSRLYLDALLGLVPLKSHGGERALRREHEIQLFEWVRAGRQNFNLASAISSFTTLLYSVFSILIILNYLNQGSEPNEVLLLFYWTLSLPTIGQSVADLIQQYPMMRNRVLRLLEPLGAPDEEEAWTAAAPDAAEAPQKAERTFQPVGIQMNDVELQAGGHAILEKINLEIQPGEHIAIIGPSGAGKSSLVGLLLGWHRPAGGQLLIDGYPLDGSRLKDLRRQTAWLDPAVQIWNWSLYENLRYGNGGEDSAPMGGAIQDADLFDVLERLPDGLKTQLGEGGGLVSGGEGQRVRLGRALLRRNVRMAILDEPFRGLDREKRRHLLRRARQRWQDTTLLCITHDVGETLQFPRVVVMEGGQIIEQGDPRALAEQPDSRYRALLNAEFNVHNSLWASAEWRRLVIEDGRLHSPGENGQADTDQPAPESARNKPG